MRRIIVGLLLLLVGSGPVLAQDVLNPPSQFRIPCSGCAAYIGASHTGDTNKTTLATIAIPGGSIGPNGSLKITTMWSFTGTAGTKTPFINYGGTDFMNTNVTTAQLSARSEIQIFNKNSTSSQVGGANTVAGVGGTSSVSPTSSIDTTVSQNLTIACQLANAGDSCTLEAVVVQAVNP